jgi:outer membrane biosynthesis protein TonB
MSRNEKRPSLLRRLFGFGSREVPETKPVTPTPTQKPAASTPSRKKSPQRQDGSEKAKRPQPAKKEAKLPSEETHQIAPTPKSSIGRASNEGSRPRVSAPKSAQTLGLTPGHIQFGMLDGNPVRFTDQEAWSLVEGSWKQIPLAEVLDDAVVLSETRYSGMFGDPPALPRAAFQR